MREETLGIDATTHPSGDTSDLPSGHTSEQNSSHTLAASLTHPDIDTPKALIIMFAGSGPIDRNENLPSFSLNIFNALAESFAEQGFACLRYDKRGCGASGGDYISSGHSDFLSDALSVTRYAKQLPGFENTPLVLLGHSEGAAIAPQVAAQIPVKALLLLCPFARPMREVLAQQAKNSATEVQAMTGFNGMLTRLIVRMRGGFDGIQRKFLNRIERSTTDTLTHAKVTLNAKWYREMLALDIQDVFRNIQTPTFALGGGKDVALKELITQAPVTTHVEGNLTHILRCWLEKLLHTPESNQLH